MGWDKVCVCVGGGGGGGGGLAPASLQLPAWHARSPAALSSQRSGSQRPSLRKLHQRANPFHVAGREIDCAQCLGNVTRTYVMIEAGRGCRMQKGAGGGRAPGFWVIPCRFAGTMRDRRNRAGLRGLALHLHGISAGRGGRGEVRLCALSPPRLHEICRPAHHQGCHGEPNTYVSAGPGRSQKAASGAS